jgi:hypothetical protein
MMQCGRTEDKVEPVGIRKVDQIADVIANVLKGSTLASDVNQPLADIDPNDLIKSFSQGNRMASGSAPRIECPTSVRRQLRHQPVQQRTWREAGGPVVVLGKAIE